MNDTVVLLANVKYKRQLVFAVFLCGIIVYLCSGYIFTVDYTVASLSQVTNVQVNGFSTEHVKLREIFVDMKDIEKSAMNIFFLETRCSTEKTIKNYLDNKGLVLNARQCCSIESTALTNPDREVFVFHSCPFSDDFLDHSPQFVRQLFNYPNVHIVRLYNSQVFVDSPVHQLFEQRQLEESSYPIEHSSDVLRLLLLWRFGGTYFDLDVVTIRSLKDLKTNWAGSPSTDLVANGVLNFEPTGAGHDMLGQVLEHINLHYDKVNWASNGPLLITPFLLRLCNVSTVPQAVVLCRGDFRVFSHQILYPLHYSRAQDLFDPSMGHQILQDVKQNSYSVHIYSKMSRDMNTTLGSTQAYVLLAQEFCPRVYNNCGTTF